MHCMKLPVECTEGRYTEGEVRGSCKPADMAAGN